jgi:hypothetical protein
MSETGQQVLVDRDKIAAETGEIAWAELQKFFAGGLVIAVVDELDLVEVAFQCASDNTVQFRAWTDAGQVAPVTDSQAREWLSANALMLAVVVKPWVLVQPRRPEPVGSA